ncbi:glycosyltransferase [Micromonospora sp. NPDC049559]|uniref:glycosyltransferase n=1 Tax=Micromonospora sp. NPDC049559 TaxID=3155923 RepID=UPI00343E05AF
MRGHAFDHDQSVRPNAWVRRLFPPLTQLTPTDGGARARVSIVVLARDEERCIARCLDSLVGGGFDDILVIDTGSVDATTDIVGRYRGSGVRLVQCRWPDSFADVRNFAIETVGSGWVVFVDADEWLTERSTEQLRACLSSLDGLAGLSRLTFAPKIYDAQSGEFDEERPRILRAESPIRFRGPVHEYPVLPGDEENPVGLVSLDIDLLHDGDDRRIAEAKGRLARNLALLEAARASDPDNPRWLFHQLRDPLPTLDGARIGELCAALGELARTRTATGDRYDARAYYRRALSLSCQRLVALGRPRAVDHHCAELDALDGGDNPDAHYFRSLLALLAGAGTAADLVRSVRLRRDDALVASSAISPTGRHLDALIVTQLATFHSDAEAARYRELCEPWDDVFFERSVLRPELGAAVPRPLVAGRPGGD